MGKAIRRVLGLSPREASFSRRGFRCDSPAVREHLEEVGACFVRGYNAALESRRPDELAARIAAQVLPPFAGFAYEGAGMAWNLLDTMTPWRRDRVRRLLLGPGEPHVYLVIVGAGWALARLPFARVEALLARLDRVLGWLTLDGYGFHDGFFRWPRSIVRQEVPGRLHGYARRAFDHGLGRSLWFVEAADPERIAGRIAGFPAARRADLWAGVGLAAAYAGGVPAAALDELRALAAGTAPGDRLGDHRAALAQGAAFAAAARARAGNLAPHTRLACERICGTTAEEAAALAERLRPTGAPPGTNGAAAFEGWRQEIQQALGGRPAAADPSSPLVQAAGPARAAGWDRLTPLPSKVTTP